MAASDRDSPVRIRAAKPAWFAAAGHARSPAAWLASLVLLGGCVVPVIEPVSPPRTPSYVLRTPPPPPPPSYVTPAAPPPRTPPYVASAPPPAGAAVTVQATASTGGDMLAVDDQPPGDAATASIGGDMLAVDDQPPGDAAPTIESFYQPLAVYGHWDRHPQYVAVWNPADPTYEPYTNGYWQASTYGWVWIANEPFGWAVNHYGRWLWDGRWHWVPDTTWGPSWVDWRVDGDHIGWAPAVPAGAAALPGARWKFIAAENMGRVDLPNAYVALDLDAVFNASHPLQRYTRAPQGEVFVAGPDPVALHERYAVDVMPLPLPAAVSGRFPGQAWHDPSTFDRERRLADIRQRQQYQRRLVAQQRWAAGGRPAASPLPDTRQRQPQPLGGTQGSPVDHRAVQRQPPGGVAGRPVDPRAQHQQSWPERQRPPQASRPGRPPPSPPPPRQPRQIHRDPQWRRQPPRPQQRPQ